MVQLEICVQTVDDALAAERGGADRLELCDRLEEGGVTPPQPVLREVLQAVRLPVMVMIRPRAGSYVYTPSELDFMKAELDVAQTAGAHGVVFGILTSHDEVELSSCEAMVRHARPLKVTFHRAFDQVRDPALATEQIIACGFDRILTSGQAANVEVGAVRIAELVERAAGRIVIMPGGGVRPGNARDLVRFTGVTEIHGSASCWIDAPAGAGTPLRRVTAESIVRGIRQAIDEV